MRWEKPKYEGKEGIPLALGISGGKNACVRIREDNEAIGRGSTVGITQPEGQGLRRPCWLKMIMSGTLMQGDVNNTDEGKDKHLVICNAIDGDRDYTPCEGENIGVLIVGVVGVLIHKENKVDIEDSVIESALKKGLKTCSENHRVFPSPSAGNTKDRTKKGGGGHHVEERVARSPACNSILRLPAPPIMITIMEGLGWLKEAQTASASASGNYMIMHERVCAFFDFVMSEEKRQKQIPRTTEIRGLPVQSDFGELWVTDDTLVVGHPSSLVHPERRNVLDRCNRSAEADCRPT
ncbi:hypothetical protein EDB87DRAFT_1577723 [Lactarius vividus]|nr:hypothetical protein EDB87DRAFT_1577723 [Lactarius vividus]